MTEAQELINNLPDWLKVGANAALFLAAVATVIIGLKQGRGRSHRGDDEDDEEEDGRSGHDAFGPGPMRDLVKSFGSMAESLKDIVRLLEDAAEDRRLSEKARLYAKEQARS